MNRYIKRLLRNDRGAITADWVALTAGILLFGLAVVYAIFNNGVAPVVGGIDDAADGLEIAQPVDYTLPSF